MGILNCRVMIGADSRIYVVSERVDNLHDADNVLDERGEPYIMYLGYLIPLNSVGDPQGKIYRIEGSNNKAVYVNKLAPNFIKAVRMDKEGAIKNVTIRLRTSTQYGKTNDAGELMVKY